MRKQHPTEKAPSLPILDLPQLPTEWEVRSLRNLVILRNGLAYNADDWKTSGVPIIRIQNLKDRDAPFNYFQGDPESQVPVHDGDLLFSWSGSKGTSFGPHLWRGPTGVLNQHIFKVIFKPKVPVVKDYLFFMLKHLTSAIEEKAYGLAALVHVRKGDLEATPIPVPRESEQQAIAQVLRTVQRAKEATEKALAATKQLKQSLLRHLFTYGPVPFDQADQVELKETEIGSMPKQWEVVPIGELIIDGPQNGMYRPQSEYGSGTPIVRIDDFVNEGGTVRTAANRVRLTPDEIESYKLAPDDILVNRVNSLSHLGKAAIIGQLTEPMVFESNMMRFSVAPHALPGFVFRFLTTPTCRGQFRTRAKRAVAQSSINQGDVKTTLMPFPARAEQEMIVHSFVAVDAKAEAERRRLKSLDTLFNTLLHHLMTGKVRVV